MGVELNQLLLLGGFGAFAAVTMILPMIRHRVRHGRGTGFVIAQVTDPVGKVVGVAVTVNSLLASAVPVVFYVAGPDVLSVWVGAPGWLGIVGFVLMGLAAVVVVTAQAQMGRHWRMCIDEGVEPGLVTSGLFGWVRNPIYAGMVLFVLGELALAPSPWTLFLVWNGALFVNLQARLEEAHLLAAHGTRYRAYASRIGRFLPTVGRLPSSSQDGSATV